MTAIKYKHLSIPSGLILAIEKYREEHPELCLRSNASAVNFAFRTLIYNEK